MIRKSILALAALTLAASAQASNYNFTGSFDSSPGTVLSGTFSTIDAQVAAGGADGSFDLSALSLTFMGESFTLAQAIDPYVQFEGGVLTGPNAAFMTAAGGKLTLESFFLGASNFTYSINGVEANGPLSISAVPEPASWAMGLAGLGVIGAITRRRRTAVAAV